MDSSERAALLAWIDFFKGCTQRQIDDIAKVVESRDLSAGDVLCRQGEPDTDIFVLVEGKQRSRSTEVRSPGSAKARWSASFRWREADGALQR